MQQELKKIIKETAEELGIDESLVRAVTDSQYEFTKLAMIQGDPSNSESFLNIRHIHLGLFVVKPFRVNAINRQNIIKDGGTTSIN